MTAIHRTVCDPNCTANPKCGLTATVDDGRITGISAAAYPTPGFENRICMMGNARLEYQYHPDRLTRPLLRVGARGDGQWKEIGWDEAIDIFVARQREIIEKYGPKAIAFTQGSGASGLLTRGSPVRYAAMLGATGVRPSGFDYGVPKGLEYTFNIPAGTYFKPGGHAFTDAVNSDVILLWGTNMMVTRSVDFKWIRQARGQGAKIICIDPTKSETATLSDQWLSPRPGSDGALALSMAKLIIDNEWYDASFLRHHTDMPFLVRKETGQLLRVSDVASGMDGADEPLVWCNDAQQLVPAKGATSPSLRKQVSYTAPNGEDIQADTVFGLFCALASQYDLETAAALTELDPNVILSVTRTYAQAKPGAIRVGYGIDRWYNSDLTARAIAALACLTGNIGRKGGGISVNEGSIPVPVNAGSFYAPGGKRVNALSWMDIDSCVKKGVPYPIKMECISLGNLFNQIRPDRKKILRDYVSELEFITVIEHFMTDTAQQADLVLPACTIFEKTDLLVDRFLQLQQKIVEPAGEAKSDFEIFKMIAEKSGFPELFEKTEDEYIDAILDAPNALLRDVNFERLKAEGVIYPWDTTEPYFGFKDRKIPTASGRAEFYKEELRQYDAELPYFREPVEASPKNPLYAKYPLVLLNSHSRYRIHSTFTNMPSIKKREPEPLARIHPTDGERRGIDDGARAKIHNDRGHVVIKCVLDEAVRPGCVIISEGHWVSAFIDGDPYSLTHDAHSPTAENWAYYDVLVEAERAD